MSREYTSAALPRLREWRLERGLSMAKLAKKAHVAKSTIVDIEAGHRAHARVRESLADALDVHSWRLVFPDDQVDEALRTDASENARLQRQLEQMTEEEIRELMDTPAGRRIHAAMQRQDDDLEEGRDAG